MDLNNPVITLCIEGTWAELEGREEDARRCYQRAWDSHTNEYEACIAAHFVARSQEDIEAALQWNLRALELAYTVQPEKIRDFYPTLYMSIAHTYKQMGGTVQAQRYFRLVAGLGEVRPHESESEMIQWLKVFDWFQPILQNATGD